jgi:hypothetical protein
MPQIIKKERAVGAVPLVPTVYEVLEEMAITVQNQLVDSKTPFCAFNGGADVFVDVRPPLMWKHAHVLWHGLRHAVHSQ